MDPLQSAIAEELQQQIDPLDTKIIIRAFPTLLSYNLSRDDYYILLSWLCPTAIKVPGKDLLYTPSELTREIWKCLSNSTWTNSYPTRLLLLGLQSLIRNKILATYQQVLISSPDMREQLTLAFDNLATAHFSRCTRARENSSSPDYEQPIEQKSRLNPQLRSRMATLLGEASS